MKRKMKIDLAEAALPDSMNGVTLNEGGSQDYLVAINSNKGDLQRAATFLHEMLHIYHDDFNSTRSAAEIEIEREAELKAIARLILEKDTSFLGDPESAATIDAVFRSHSVA